MTEEDYFRKTYPDYCYGDKPLSPYWDLFQYGVEFGEQQSENKIADIKANCDLAIEGRDIKIKELEKENAELKEQVANLEGIKLAQETALNTEYNIKECLIKENAELKDDNKVMADNYSKMEQKFYNNLTKAKELLKKMYYLYFNPCVTEQDLENRDKLFEEVKQFIKE